MSLAERSHNNGIWRIKIDQDILKTIQEIFPSWFGHPTATTTTSPYSSSSSNKQQQVYEQDFSKMSEGKNSFLTFHVYIVFLSRHHIHLEQLTHPRFASLSCRTKLFRWK